MKLPMPMLVRADARALPLPDASVDLIVTSPPYFALRSYVDGGEHYAGQIGSEATPAEWLDALIARTAEMVRVLKPTGSIFVNLGDKYAGSGAGGGTDRTTLEGTTQLDRREGRYGRRVGGAPAKSLLGLPWRYALRCMDELGLILRAEIIWSKPNGLPESVSDRVRRSHEQWFHFTVSPYYYAAVDEIREPHAPKTLTHRGGGLAYGDGANHYTDAALDQHRNGFGGGATAARRPDPLGTLPGSVWTIPTQRLTVPAELGVDHFAAFPMAWPRRLILGWSPREVCTACGEGRRPATHVSYAKKSPGIPGGTATQGRHRQPTFGSGARWTITGYACACPDITAPATPGVVLDAFGGTGTTALVATMLGRRGVSVELSADYCRLARWRAGDPKQRAQAAGLDPDAVAAITPEAPGQLDLLAAGGVL